MATKTGKNTKTGNKQNIQSSPSRKASAVTVKKDLLGYLDDFFEKREKSVLYIALALAGIFAILLFEVKPGIGGDDSSYILRTFDLLHSRTYPGYQGPMYPFVLAPFMAVFGINLPLLKFLSFIFILVSIYFTYRAFSKKFPQQIVAFTIILLSINYFLLYFASQTYSEAFFLMVQAIFFWYFSKKFFTSETEQKKFTDFLYLGLLLFIMAITKNIAYAAIMSVLAYFLFTKQWRSILQTFLGFLIFFVGFEIIKRIFWGNQELQFASQGSGLLYKDFYNPTEGYETFSGFISRFLENSGMYFSKHFFTFIGFRPEITTVSSFLTILIWLVLIVAFIRSYKKNNLMFFTSIYVIGMCSATFIVLQTRWDQWRLIIIEFPFLLMLLFAAIYYVTKAKKLSYFQIILPVLAIIIFFSSFKFTSGKAKIQKEILAKNINGNMLYGYTPDWINYIEMSKWVAKNTPKNVYTGVRKADISFIYGERRFYGITKVPSISIDSLLALMPDTMINIGIKATNILNTSIFANKDFRMKTIGVINGKFSFGDNVVDEGNIIIIYSFSKSEFPMWEQSLKQAGIYFDTNMKEWVKNIPKISNDYGIYLPDMLLDQLKRANVRYLMLASLRSNPNQNTGNIITTVHRFMYMIEMKYPEIFKTVNSIGESEGAQLVQISYN